MIKKETYLTGHMYRGSAYETSDDCGNCDGANCENCRRISTYIVSVTIPIDDNGVMAIETLHLYVADTLDEAKEIQNNIYCFECYGNFDNINIKSSNYSFLDIRKIYDNKAKIFFYIKNESLEENIKEIKNIFRNNFTHVMNISKIIDL